MTLNELKERFPNATDATWHQHANGGGWVQNTASVDETAFVGPDASVSGNASVCDNADIREGEFSRPVISVSNTPYSFTECSDGEIRSGCIKKPVAWWRENVLRCAEEYGYTPEQQQLARLAVEYVAAAMDVVNKKEVIG